LTLAKLPHGNLLMLNNQNVTIIRCVQHPDAAL
jgi:hypothetical protein